MDIDLVDFQHVSRPHARGNLPPSYLIAELRVTANNLDEVREMMQAMQRWADGTFEPTIIERDADGVLVVHNQDPRPRAKTQAEIDAEREAEREAAEAEGRMVEAKNQEEEPRSTDPFGFF